MNEKWGNLSTHVYIDICLRLNKSRILTLPWREERNKVACKNRFIHGNFVQKESTNHLQIVFFQLTWLINSKFNMYTNFTMYWINTRKEREMIINTWFGLHSPRDGTHRKEKRINTKAIGNTSDMPVGNQSCRGSTSTPLRFNVLSHLWGVWNVFSVNILKNLWNINSGIDILDKDSHFGGSSLK